MSNFLHWHQQILTMSYEDLFGSVFSIFFTHKKTNDTNTNQAYYLVMPAYRHRIKTTLFFPNNVCNSSISIQALVGTAEFIVHWLTTTKSFQYPLILYISLQSISSSNRLKRVDGQRKWWKIPHGSIYTNQDS